MHQHRNAKHGMILLSVLCMVFALSLSTYYFSEKLLNDLEFITAQQAAVARRLAADSGVSYAAALTDAPEWPRLMQQRDRQPFQDILIASPRDDMFCTLVHPLTHRRGPLQLGMLDESSKLNLNALRWDEEYAD